MRELSLFTGAGGGLLGTKLLGWKHCGYVEINEYCQKVIAQRIRDGLLDDAPIFSDIRAFISQGYAESYQGMVDVVTGGFPCQPFSVSGKRRGEDDERNMWPATIECIRLVRPRFCLLENVPGLLTSGYFGTVIGELAQAGFDARWCCISPVRRTHRFPGARLWVLASARGIGRHIPEAKARVNSKNDREPQKSWCKNGGLSTEIHGGRIYCFPNTDTERSFDDVADWMDRIKAAGNGQVPAVVRAAWNLLTS